jgi:tripartite-type tricarboxylate transporter receptor subunit TctC
MLAGHWSDPAHSQAVSPTWPQKSVRFVIPLPPGSGTDLAARLLAERLTERWGQPVVIENRQGADGIPAVTAVLSARDNHTFLLSFAGVVTFNHLLHERLPYDLKEIVPITPVVDNFLGVSATAVLKVNTLAELIASARAQPGKLNWAATPGLPYYVLLALQKSAGIDMVQVAYRDFAPAYQDLNTGRLHVAGTGVPTLVPHHRAGTARMMFVTNRDRSPQAPDVPTAAEAGYPDLTFEGTVGLYGTRDTSEDARRRIASDVNATIADPAFHTRAVGVGVLPRRGTPQEFAAAIEDQRAKVGAIHASAPKPK